MLTKTTVCISIGGQLLYVWLTQPTAEPIRTENRAPEKQALADQF